MPVCPHMHSLLFMIMSKGQLSGTLFTAYTLHSFTMLMQDIFKLYGFTMLVQAVILIPYAANAHHFHQTAKQIAIRIGDALVRSAPPGLPAVMLFCGFFSKFRLSKQDVEVTFPERLKLGADTSVVCFDKTGTLTGSTVSHACSLMSNASIFHKCCRTLMSPALTVNQCSKLAACIPFWT